ncbi:MAG: HAMP domain-containing histidine kinase [Clostridia bacterium]|nr:HAMP domain-containing histidine kinase [Clostridia bacterium]
MSERHGYRYTFKHQTIVGLCFIGLMAIFLSFIFSTVLSSQTIVQESQLDQLDAARYVQSLAQQTELSPEELAKLATTSSLTVSVLSDLTPYTLTPYQLMQLNEHKVMVLYTFARHPVTLFMAGNHYYMISVNQSVNLFQTAIFRVFLTLALTLLFLTVLIFSLTGRLIRPVTQLSQAIQKVAKGDFTVRLPVEQQDEVGQLMENFNYMTAELQSIEYLQKDFISNVSHEFKTPIASIQGFATLLQSPDLDEASRQEYTGIIVKESRRLSRLSQNLLKLSKLENQHRLDNPAPYALDEQLRQTVLLLQPEWEPKAILWELEDMPSVTYTGDEALMQQVWINLLGNAIKFSPPGGEITLRLTVGEKIRVDIADQGPGMVPEVQKRIFDRFYQGDSSHKEEGNGLGLALCQRIVELSKGVISVQSQPEKGSLFTVELPLKSA